MKSTLAVIISLLALTGCGPQIGTITVQCQPLVGVWNFVDGPAGPSSVSLAADGTAKSYLDNSSIVLLGTWTFSETVQSPIEGNLRITWNSTVPTYLTNGFIVNQSLFGVTESLGCNSLSERYLGSE